MMKKLLPYLFVFSISSLLYAQQAYYNDVNLTLTGTQLRDALATKVINTHTNALSYSEIWDASRITDEDPNNSSNVLLIYGWENGNDSDVTNDLSRSKNDNGGNVGDWNREHTFANSLANPDLDDSGTSGPPYSDAHNLRPSDVQRNGQRGNRLFSTGSGNSSAVGAFWYPGDATQGGTDWRGDVARIVMYMYIRYGNQCAPDLVANGTTNSVDSRMIDLLLDWNAADPVSAIEDARNTYHDGTATYSQGNRNPFIDNPRLATQIWGGTPAEDRWGIYGGSDTQAPTVPTNLMVSNETSSTLDVSWTASTDDTAVTSYDIYVDGVLNTSSATNSATITGLSASTTYSITVLAKDAANNMSAQSTAVNGTTTMTPPAGTDCASEDFINIPTNSSSSYQTRTWTGDGGTWTATDARTDQNLNGKSICIRNGTLTSPTIAGGIGDLTVTTQLTFSGSAGTFNVLVNGNSVGSIPYSGDNTSSTTTTLSNIDISGNITLVLDNQSTSNRVRIDDLSWTCAAPLSVDEFELINNVKLYPNPNNSNRLNITTTNTLDYSIYNLLGKNILIGKTTGNIDITSLKQGIYLVKLKNEKGVTVTKKLIRQ